MKRKYISVIIVLVIILAGAFTHFSGGNGSNNSSNNVVSNSSVKTTTEDNDQAFNDSSVSYSDDNASDTVSDNDSTTPAFTFRNSDYRQEHYEKHGISMGFSSAEEYEQAAAKVVTNSSALHKTEAEDGDDVYYLEDTNEFVIVSTDGYIRTYFNPDDGIDYYNRQ